MKMMMTMSDTSDSKEDDASDETVLTEEQHY